MMLIWSKYTKDTRELQQELHLCQMFRKKAQEIRAGRCPG